MKTKFPSAFALAWLLTATLLNTASCDRTGPPAGQPDRDRIE